MVIHVMVNFFVRILVPIFKIFKNSNNKFNLIKNDEIRLIYDKLCITRCLDLMINVYSSWMSGHSLIIKSDFIYKIINKRSLKKYN